jgi:hypothetical protein
MKSLRHKQSHQFLSLLWLILFIAPSLNLIADDNDPVAINEIREHVFVISYLYKNNHFNLGVIEQNNGLMLINSPMEWGYIKYESLLKTISNKPVKYIINNNDRPFNQQGNKFWSEKGAVIISHNNFDNSSSEHQLLFSDQLLFTFGSEPIVAFQSSTRAIGNINIYLTKANVVFLADENGLISYEAGLEKALNMGNEQTLFVSGNTGNKKIMDTSEIRRLRTNINNFIQRVEQLYQQGNAVNEITNDRLLDESAQQFEKKSAYRQSIRSRVISILESNINENFPLSPQKSLSK